MKNTILFLIFIVLGIVSIIMMGLAEINKYRSDTRSRDDGATSEDFDRWEHRERVFGGFACCTLILMTMILPGILL